jgi:hypothetical protein
MSAGRRYQDHEIRRIVDLALRREEARADAEIPELPTSNGLTKSELEEVGKGVGLSPASMARAIVEFEARGETLPVGTRLGMPTSLGHAIPLRRAPTDQEWRRIVTELRTTFGHKGEMAGDAELREWSAGNLHAFVEPVEGGYRLRLSDSVDNEVVVGWLFGGFCLAFALLIFVILLGKNDPGFRFVIPAFSAILGSALIVSSTATLPGWARRRQQLMEQVASRMTALMASGANDPPNDPSRMILGSGDVPEREEKRP